MRPVPARNLGGANWADVGSGKRAGRPGSKTGGPRRERRCPCAGQKPLQSDLAVAAWSIELRRPRRKTEQGQGSTPRISGPLSQAKRFA
jgi:hypothetical protein